MMKRWYCSDATPVENCRKTSHYRKVRSVASYLAVLICYVAILCPFMSHQNDHVQRHRRKVVSLDLSQRLR